MSLARILVVISVILAVLGCLLQMSGKDEFRLGNYRVTKKHLLHDALYLLILAIAVRMIFKA
jgi:uncharacterized membrane protein YidH (DUF202 family)